MINEAGQPGPPLADGESASGCLGPFLSTGQEAIELSTGRLTRVWLMAFLCHASPLVPYIFMRE